MNTSSIVEYIANYPSIPLAVAIVILLLYVLYLHRKLHTFTRGETGSSLEDLIKNCVASVSEIEKRNELISEHALSLDTRVSQALRNAQMIRYKAFETGSSNQSFSIALLNEKGSGVVLSSLHTRDRINTFAKPIEKYTSTFELTDEELEVIKEAKLAHKK